MVLLQNDPAALKQSKIKQNGDIQSVTRHTSTNDISNQSWSLL